jgi:sodium-independent sulfate anion transporter 11
VANTKSVFTYKTLSKRLPILQWAPVYTPKDFIGDLLAGITVGLTLIPQSMAYSTLAGLPPQVNTRPLVWVK